MNRSLMIVVVAALACAHGCARGHRHIEVRSIVDKNGNVPASSPLALRVQQQHRGKCVDFEAVVGATTRTERGIRVEIRNSAPSLSIANGWVYVHGTSPYAIGSHVSVGSTDATFILFSNSNCDLIIFLCSTSNAALVVTATSGGTPVTMPEAGTYMKVCKENGNLVYGPITPIPDPDDADTDGVRALMSSTKTAVLQAQMTWCEPD